MSIEEWNEVHERRKAEWAARSFESFVPDPRVAKIVAQHAAKSDNPNERTKWLDVGCGIALTAQWIAAQRNYVWGFDGSQAALSIALHRLTANKNTWEMSWPWLIHADAEKPWPYSGDVFDVVVDVRCLENLDSGGLLIAYIQARRVLKPGGFFYSIAASPKRDDSLTAAGTVRKPTDEQIFDDLKAAGLSLHSLWDTVMREGGREVADWVITARKPAA